MTHPVRGGLLPRLMLAAVAALLLALAPLAARADEVITSYNTAVRLAVNGTVDVIETITVRAEADATAQRLRDEPVRAVRDQVRREDAPDEPPAPHARPREDAEREVEEHFPELHRPARDAVVVAQPRRGAAALLRGGEDAG